MLRWLSIAAACDVQIRPPVTPDGAIGASAQVEKDLPVEALPFPVLHGDVAGERVEQLDVALGVVDSLSVEMPDALVDRCDGAGRSWPPTIGNSAASPEAQVLV